MCRCPYVDAGTDIQRVMCSTCFVHYVLCKSLIAVIYLSIVSCLPLPPPLSSRDSLFLLLVRYYFKTPQDSTPRCIIALENCAARPVTKKRSFEIFSTDGKVIKSVKREGGKLVQGKHAKFLLQCDSDEDRREWVEKLTMGLQEVRHPAYDYIKQKKEEVQKKLQRQRHSGAGVLSGWMYKKGRINTSWKKRFFVLYLDSPPRPRLYYFSSDRGARRMADLGEDTAQGFIELDRVVAVQRNADPKAINAPKRYVLLRRRLAMATLRRAPEEPEGGVVYT